MRASNKLPARSGYHRGTLRIFTFLDPCKHLLSTSYMIRSFTRRHSRHLRRISQNIFSLLYILQPNMAALCLLLFHFLGNDCKPRTLLAVFLSQIRNTLVVIVYTNQIPLQNSLTHVFTLLTSVLA